MWWRINVHVIIDAVDNVIEKRNSNSCQFAATVRMSISLIDFQNLSVFKNRIYIFSILEKLINTCTKQITSRNVESLRRSWQQNGLELMFAAQQYVYDRLGFDRFSIEPVDPLQDGKTWMGGGWKIFINTSKHLQVPTVTAYRNSHHSISFTRARRQYWAALKRTCGVPFDIYVH